MIPLLMAAGMAAMQAKQAQDAKKQARQAGDTEALQSSAQTAYSGLTGFGPGGPVKYDAGPNVMGQALAGGVAGYSQGQAFGDAAMQSKYNENAYKMLLDKQAQQQSGVPSLGQGKALPATAYSYNQTMRA